MDGPGKAARSSGRASRRSSAGPYSGRSSSRGSTGLTKYLGESSLEWEGGEKEEDARASGRTRSLGQKVAGVFKGKAKAKPADDGEMDVEPGRSTSTFGRALSSFRPGKVPQPKEIDLWKPNADDVLGITFEVPEDSETYKGVVVAEIHPGFLMARAKKLQQGDVVHAINGMPVATPEEVPRRRHAAPRRAARRRRPPPPLR